MKKEMIDSEVMKSDQSDHPTLIRREKGIAALLCCVHALIY